MGPPHGSPARRQAPPARSIALVLWCSGALVPRQFIYYSHFLGALNSTTALATRPEFPLAERAFCPPSSCSPLRHSFNIHRRRSYTLSCARASWLPSPENRPAARRLGAHAQGTSKVCTHARTHPLMPCKLPMESEAEADNVLLSLKPVTRSP